MRLAKARRGGASWNGVQTGDMSAAPARGLPAPTQSASKVAGSPVQRPLRPPRRGRRSARSRRSSSSAAPPPTSSAGPGRGTAATLCACSAARCSSRHGWQGNSVPSRAVDPDVVASGTLPVLATPFTAGGGVADRRANGRLGGHERSISRFQGLRDASDHPASNVASSNRTATPGLTSTCIPLSSRIRT